MAICGNFRIFFPFWYVVPRKIWQPCYVRTLLLLGKMANRLTKKDGGRHPAWRHCLVVTAAPELRVGFASKWAKDFSENFFFS
jgi:hypothetical protein